MVHRLWLLKEVIKRDRRSKVSWKSFMKLVEKYQCGYMVYPSFYFINRLYDTSIPGSVMGKIKPNGDVDHVYKLKTERVFDERVDLSRIFNKLSISWTFSPQPFYKRIRLFVSPSLIFLAFTYAKPLLRYAHRYFRSVFLMDIKPSRRVK
jgi:hypothetical protein